MKILLDSEACVGHGRCYALAPMVFAPDDMGHCEILVIDPTPEQEAATRSGVANCPEDALKIEE